MPKGLPAFGGVGWVIGALQSDTERIDLGAEREAAVVVSDAGEDAVGFVHTAQGARERGQILGR